MLSDDLTCIIIDDEPHAIAELEEMIDQVPGVQLERSFTNAREAITHLHESGKVDVIFSDINMPGISGIEAANVFQSYCDFLVFVTAYRDYALEAIRAKVEGYLMKPVSYMDFANQIIEIKSKIADTPVEADEFLFLKGDHKNNYFKVMCNDIVYIKGMLNYVQVYTTKQKHITYSLLGDIEEELAPRNLFIRISKSIVISILHLNMVEGNMAFLDNEMSFPVGLTYRKNLTSFVKNRHVGRGKIR